MVPMGDLAFMPGELVHTNEVMVLLGDNYFVERSAHQASEIIERRVQVIDDMIDKTEKKVKDLALRCDLSAQARNAVLSTLGAQPVPQSRDNSGRKKPSKSAKAKEGAVDEGLTHGQKEDSDDDEEGKV
jgi:unconventional prefoldin RPB5 interactor 1